MSWFKKILPKVGASAKKGVPEGLWEKCPACLAVLYRAELNRNQFVCNKCDAHMRLSVAQRLEYFLDSGDYEEIGNDEVAVDRLKFRDSKKYKERIATAVKKTSSKEALKVVKAKLQGMPVVVACFDFSFIGGSMSAAVGERFILGVEAAITDNVPFICFTASGGARMQEGLFSLMQMARTSAVLGRLAAEKLPYIVILTDPTMGGVSASLATLGDVLIAEPKALIGFSGPRVIEQTIRQVLPDGFQRSEFLLEHGAIDMVIDRRQLPLRVASLLRKFMHAHARFQAKSSDHINTAGVDLEASDKAGHLNKE